LKYNANLCHNGNILKDWELRTLYAYKAVLKYCRNKSKNSPLTHQLKFRNQPTTLTNFLTIMTLSQ